jgi:3-dehydroquinate dehydratase-1
VDVELACGMERTARLVKKAREQGILTVVSKHDFRKTPPVLQMVASLTAMKALGADLPKLAVMPQSPLDVLALMEASVKARERLGPVITMSMGELGAVSRLAGELTGSCLTFGAGASASAPGQLPAAKLWEALALLHQEKGGACHEE